MAVTQNSYTGNGSTTTYSFTFPYLKSADIKAQINATDTTAFTLPTATTLQFNTAPANGDKIKIYRKTDDESLTATFYAGSSLKSEDLNDNFTQNLYTTQEVNARYLSNLGGTMVGDLAMGEDAVITFEGATDNAHETTLTVTDPTADRTITLPNVTGTVVTTGDTGSVTTQMIQDATIVNADIANATITGAKLVNDTITAAQIAADAVGASELANNAVDSNAIAGDAVNAGHIADDTINSEHYVADSIDTEHYAPNSVDNAALGADCVHGDNIADNAINSEHYVAGSIDLEHMSANSVDSDQYVDGSIDTIHIASDAITGGLIADDTINSEHYAAGSIDNEHIANNAVTGAKLADNLDIPDGNTIRFGDSQDLRIHHTSDNSFIEDTGTGDLVLRGTDIRLEKSDTSKYVEATADGSVDVYYNGSKKFETTNTGATVTGVLEVSGGMGNNTVPTSAIVDAELTTLSDMQSGTASILAGGTALTATLTELNLLDGKSVVTSVSGSSTDVQLPTAKAVNDQILAVTNALGGFVAIADKDNFPTSNPDPSGGAGTVVSISNAAGISVNSSGVGSLATRAGGSDAVIINGFPSALRGGVTVGGATNANPYILPASVGLQVQTTSTAHTYDYHKYLINEEDANKLSGDIQDFQERYRVNAGEPSDSLHDGDLVWDTNADKMKVYDSTASAWKEVTSAGDFKFLVPVDAGTTTAATFDGSDTSFDLKEDTNSGSAASVTNVNQLTIVLNGVVQKPNAGSWSASNEGFHLTDSDTIRFCTAPPTGSTCFIIQSGSAVTINSPGNNTVATATIQNGAVTNDKVNASAAIAGSKISPDFGSQNILTTGRVLLGTTTEGEGDADDLTVAGTGNTGITIRSGTSNDGAVFFSDGTSGTAEYEGTIQYLHSSDAMIFKTDHAERLRIDEYGRVMIGQSAAVIGSSAEFAEIVLSGKTKGAGITLQDVDANVRFQIRTDDDNSSDPMTLLNASTNHPIAIRTNNTERIRIANGGNVGIGTSSPDQILHIKTSVNNTAVATIESTATDSYPYLKLKNDAKEYQLTCHGGQSDAFTIYDGTAGNHRFTISSDGKVGIGDTAPASLLSLKGTNPTIRFTDGSTLVGAFEGDTTQNTIYGYNGADVVISTSATNGYADRFKIDTAGDAFAYGNFLFDNATNAGRDIQWQHGSDRLAFFDNTLATFGDGVDLQIHHNGSSNYIQSNNGVIHLRGNAGLHFDTIGSAHTWAKFNSSDASSSSATTSVELYYANVKKFETTVNGANINGLGVITGDLGGNYIAQVIHDGNNVNRYGLSIQCGTDDASGANYAISIADGDGTAQGQVTFTGGTITYGTFTAHHPCIVPDADNPSNNSNAYPYGTLLETISIEYTKNKDGSNTERGIRYKVQKTQSANSKKVLGAYGSSMNGGPDDQTNEHQALVLGDGHILCNNAGGNIEVGDGICSSSTAGIGQKATVNPSMIIGIAQEAVTFTGSETKLVPVQYGLQQFIPWT